MSPLEKLGAAIKTARIKTDMTQDELAQVLCITTHHLGAIENGRRKPSYDLLCLLLNKLDISIDGVFYPDCVHNRKEIEDVIAMLHYCDEKDLAVISAALHAIMRFK